MYASNAVDYVRNLRLPPRSGIALPRKKPRLLERSLAKPVTFGFRLGYTLLRHPKISNVFFRGRAGFLKLLFLVTNFRGGVTLGRRHSGAVVKLRGLVPEPSARRLFMDRF